MLDGVNRVRTVPEGGATLGVADVFGKGGDPLASGHEDQTVIDGCRRDRYVGVFSRMKPDAGEDCFGFEGLLLERKKLSAKVGRRHSASFVSRCPVGALR